MDSPDAPKPLEAAEFLARARKGSLPEIATVLGGDLSGADLSGLDLHDTILKGVSLRGARLSGANLSGAI